MFEHGAIVIIVGDVTSVQARQMVGRYLGSWSAKPQRKAGKVRTFAPEGTRTSSPRIILVDRPGATQSAVVVGKATVSPTDPRYFGLLSLNRLLGVGVSSRLNRSLRERHGYTYGVTSFVEARRGLSLFSIEGSMRANTTDSAIVELIGEYTRLGQGDVSPAEFEVARNSLVGSFPSSMQTVQTVRSRITNLVCWGAGADYYGNYRDRLNAVTLKARQRSPGRFSPLSRS